MRFRDRIDAGQGLASVLGDRDFVDPVVVGLPRGGVPVAEPVARSIGAPVDVLVVRKVGAPRQPEWAIGAVAEGGVVVRDERSASSLGLSDQEFERLVDDGCKEIDRRARAYRSGRIAHDVGGRDVLLVDDGLATGATAEAAARSLHARGPRRVILAVPVASGDAVRRLARVVDEVVVLAVPDPFTAVGCWYWHFDQTTDDEVIAVLDRSVQAG